MPYISLSAEVEMREEAQRDKRKSRKFYPKTLQANKPTANLLKKHKTKPDRVNRWVGHPCILEPEVECKKVNSRSHPIIYL